MLSSAKIVWADLLDDHRGEERVLQAGELEKVACVTEDDLCVRFVKGNEPTVDPVSLPATGMAIEIRKRRYRQSES